jgi:hypothetical protein
VKKKPWLSIVIPTIGRPDLLMTLDAIDSQPEDLLEGVEVLVVGDTYGGRTPDLEQVFEHLSCERPLGRYRYMEHDGGVHCYGQPQRTFGAANASGEWVWFGQDDNVANKDALHAIRVATTAADAPRLCIFRWLAPWREVIWRSQILEQGNVDADCLVMRRELAASVKWGMRYEGDFDAALEAAALAETVGWQDAIVSIARPERGHCWWLR